MKNSSVVFLRWLRLAFYSFFCVVVTYFVFNWSLRSFSEGSIIEGIVRLLIALTWLLTAGGAQFRNGRGLAAELSGRIPCGIPLKVQYRREITRYSNGQGCEKIILILKDEKDKFLFFELSKTKFSTTDFPPLFFLEKDEERNFIVHEIKA
ncbi:MAG: hypothetical protein NT161_03490 [Candidatus Nomurabacteria bacterium]|nr:hypothetical protein [Candidatus Nomurabacteria bacterium]